MTINPILLVVALAVAGAAGAVLRAVIERALPGRPDGLPWGLLLVNSLGCALAAVLTPCTTGMVRTIALVGLCGALTTYSGFAWRVHQHLRAGQAAVGLTTIALMTGSCVGVFAGTWWLVTQGLSAFGSGCSGP